MACCLYQQPEMVNTLENDFQDPIIFGNGSDGRRVMYETILPRARIQELLQVLDDSRSGRHYDVNRTLARGCDRFTG